MLKIAPLHKDDIRFLAILEVLEDAIYLLAISIHDYKFTLYYCKDIGYTKVAVFLLIEWNTSELYKLNIRSLAVAPLTIRTYNLLTF